MREDVKIKFEQKNDRWTWHLSKGKFQSGGMHESLEKAEQYAFEVANELPDVGVIHTSYNPGKPTEPATGTFEDALVNEGFKKSLEEVMNDPKTQEILDKLGSDYDSEGVAYWDKWDNDFGNP